MPGLEERKTKRPVRPKSPPWEGRKQAPDAFSGNQQHELSACTAPKSAPSGADWPLALLVGAKGSPAAAGLGREKNKRLAFGPAGRGKSTWVVLFFLL